MLKKQLRSPVAWSAMLGITLYLLKSCGILEPLGITDETLKTGSSFIAAVLTAIGVFHRCPDCDGTKGKTESPT